MFIIKCPNVKTAINFLALPNSLVYLVWVSFFN